MVTAFSLLLISFHVSGTLYGPSLLTSHVGGSVKIKFYYATTIANKNDRKFWCKESGHDNCYTVTSTNDFTNKSYQGRVSIQDFPQYGCLFVTMTQLEEKDSGYYRCGIGKNKNGLCTGVNLTVWEGSSPVRSPDFVLGKIKGSVAIQCPSEAANSNEKKFLCKLKRSHCVNIADTKKDVSKQHEEKIVFTAGESSETFQVLINGLRNADSGMYRCGTGALHHNYGNTKMIQLRVVDESIFSNFLRERQTRYEPQTPRFHSHDEATTSNEVYKSSKSEPNLLAIMIPVAILLVLAVTVIVLVRLRQRRQCGSGDIAARNPEGEKTLADQRCLEELLKGKKDSQEAALDPDKEIPVSPDYCFLGQVPDSQDSGGNV